VPACSEGQITSAWFDIVRDRLARVLFAVTYRDARDLAFFAVVTVLAAVGTYQLAESEHEGGDAEMWAQLAIYGAAWIALVLCSAMLAGRRWLQSRKILRELEHVELEGIAEPHELTQFAPLYAPTPKLGKLCTVLALVSFWIPIIGILPSLLAQS